jgi:hypothetical protein
MCLACGVLQTVVVGGLHVASVIPQGRCGPGLDPGMAMIPCTPDSPRVLYGFLSNASTTALGSESGQDGNGWVLYNALLLQKNFLLPFGRSVQDRTNGGNGVVRN